MPNDRPGDTRLSSPSRRAEHKNAWPSGSRQVPSSFCFAVTCHMVDLALVLPGECSLTPWARQGLSQHSSCQALA